ncbi:MAG: hypothetical protein IJS23_02885 [Clostridia bacterium]|nr:hypothetical protein [Clostridia bacterium]
MTTTSIIMTIICLALIAFCCWAIFKRANNDHKAKTQYDERQNVIRGRGYMFGFWTVLVFLGILFIMETFGITLPVAPFSLGFIGAILGATVMSVYNVWKGAYWGLNNNRKQYIIIFAFLLLFNLIPIIGAWKTEGFLNVIQGSSLVNIGVEFMLIALGAALLLRQLKDKNEEAEG